MNTTTTTNLIQVGKCVLNNKAIEQMEAYQEDDNKCLNESMMVLLQAIRYVASTQYLCEDKSKTENLLQGLGNVIDEIECFLKP